MSLAITGPSVCFDRFPGSAMLSGKPRPSLKSHHRMRLIRRLQLVDLFRRQRQIHRLQQVIELFLTRRPIIGAATPGLLNSQASATWARLASSSSATSARFPAICASFSSLAL
jgi:hypothetical protein